MDLTESIIPKSDQLNAEDFIGGPQTYTIREVKDKRGAEQPVDIVLEETNRVYRPSKTMRRVLVAAWGPRTEPYAGRKLTLYRDPEVRFGGDKVGGIKISHLSHIEQPLSIALTVTRSRREMHTVDVLTGTPEQLPVGRRVDAALGKFEDLGIGVDRLEAKLGRPREDWGSHQLVDLGAWYTAITRDGADPSALIPALHDSRRDNAPGGAPAVEEEAPGATGAASAGGAVGDPLPIDPVGPSLLSGTKARLRGQAIAAIEQEFERLLGAPLDEDEVNWWAGIIVGHPVTGGSDLDTDDLRKLQARLPRFHDRQQLETELGGRQ